MIEIATYGPGSDNYKWFTIYECNTVYFYNNHSAVIMLPLNYSEIAQLYIKMGSDTTGFILERFNIERITSYPTDASSTSIYIGVKIVSPTKMLILNKPTSHFSNSIVARLCYSSESIQCYGSLKLNLTSYTDSDLDKVITL